MIGFAGGGVTGDLVGAGVTPAGAVVGLRSVDGALALVGSVLCGGLVVIGFVAGGFGVGGFATGGLLAAGVICFGSVGGVASG